MNAVLFVNIGWAQRYDGTETVQGNHGWLREHPDDNSEMEAFLRDRNGLYWCGIGTGRVNVDALDVVFVALYQGEGHRAVLLYRDARCTYDSDGANPYARASTRKAWLIPVANRPAVEWPGRMSMRRWAYRAGARGKEWPGLADTYRTILTLVSPPSKEVAIRSPAAASPPRYIEGAAKQHLVDAVERDPRARVACIDHYGSRCFVCSLAMEELYGAEAAGCIHVHHLTPVSKLLGPGVVDPIRDLRPVCPNCHAVIHLRRDPPFSPEEVRAMLRRGNPAPASGAPRIDVPVRPRGGAR